MAVVRANGIDIWYELLGSGPTVALTHGWQGPTQDWPAGILDRLAEHARLLVYDVRGHGRTEAPEDAEAYSLPIYARDLRALLDALEIERPHIAGVSQGGMIAAQFAVDFPERTRSLLLCDSTAGNGADEGPGGDWERTLQRHFDFMAEYAREHGLLALAKERTRLARERDAHYFDYPEAPEERERKHDEKHTRMPLHAFLGTCLAIRRRPDLTARLRDVAVPALVVGGEWDRFYDCAERDHGLLEGSRFVRVLRCGHASPDWRPDVFVSAVTDFIADVEAGRDVAGEQER